MVCHTFHFGCVILPDTDWVKLCLQGFRTTFVNKLGGRTASFGASPHGCPMGYSIVHVYYNTGLALMQVFPNSSDCSNLVLLILQLLCESEFADVGKLCTLALQVDQHEKAFSAFRQCLPVLQTTPILWFRLAQCSLATFSHNLAEVSCCTFVVCNNHLSTRYLFYT